MDDSKTTTSVTDRTAGTREQLARHPAMQLAGVLLKTVGAMAAIFPILWAAYTYYHQGYQQRRQDFLRAYDIVHGNLGTGITDSINAAIKPIYNSTDDKFAKARLHADEATTPAEKAAAIVDIQHWIVENILVKDKNPIHDRQIQDYQQALRNLVFLYEYAKTDECTALVVAYRFREIAYIFWYYYPGSYNFEKSSVTASMKPDPAHDLVDQNWLSTQQDGCTLEARI
jgi:hypothetical protein